MNEGYQYGFSKNSPYVFDAENRERKARTMIAVLEDFVHAPLDSLALLNVGGSAGGIDNYLAGHFGHVVGLDIDDEAIGHAKRVFSRSNLHFCVADALDLPFPDGQFDVVVCSHVYEHVPDPAKMFSEIHRVLGANGICYFAAGNRLMWNEPHYNLPLLSVIPRPLGHWYIRLAGKANHYHEKHLFHRGLRRLVSDFEITDYTSPLIEHPKTFHTDYMLPPGSLKARAAQLIVKFMYWAVPSYVWILSKQKTR